MDGLKLHALKEWWHQEMAAGCVDGIPLLISTHGPPQATPVFHQFQGFPPHFNIPNEDFIIHGYILFWLEAFFFSFLVVPKKMAS